MRETKKKKNIEITKLNKNMPALAIIDQPLDYMIFTLSLVD
jgi:hypothetical protein